MARSHLRRLQHRGGLWGRWGRRLRHILHDPTSRSRQKRQRTAEQRQRLISDAAAGHGESALRGMLRCAKRTLAVAVAARQPAQGQKVPRRLVAEVEERLQAQAPLATTPQSPPHKPAHAPAAAPSERALAPWPQRQRQWGRRRLSRACAPSAAPGTSASRRHGAAPCAAPRTTRSSSSTVASRPSPRNSSCGER